MNDIGNRAHIFVSGPRAQEGAPGTTACVIGRDLTIDPQALEDYCAVLLRDIEHDLVILCGVVAFADRVVKRKRASGLSRWARDIEVTVPVCEPDMWQKASTQAALVDALEFVTGDTWHFNFISGGKRTSVKQSSLDFSSGPYIVLPSSDGMDSFLQWQLLKVQEPGSSILRIQTLNRSTDKARNKAIDAAGSASDQRLRLPISIAVGTHPEPSYRTRTFLFFCMAALAAVKAGSRRVVIGENGVGALGPSMIQYGNEAPHRTTHPAFTRRLQTFLNELLGTDLAFEHPQIFLTKGEVLTTATELGVQGWEKTKSCVRGQRDGLNKLSCGVCSGCLLRRSAILAAGMKPTGYFWENLNAGTLDASRSNPNGREAKPNDLEIMHHGAHAMTELAGLASLEAEADVFQRAAWDLGGPVKTGLDETARKIHRLVSAHGKEWQQFHDHYGPSNALTVGEVS